MVIILASQVDKKDQFGHMPSACQQTWLHHKSPCQWIVLALTLSSSPKLWESPLTSPFFCPSNPAQHQNLSSFQSEYPTHSPLFTLPLSQFKTNDQCTQALGVFFKEQICVEPIVGEPVHKNPMIKSENLLKHIYNKYLCHF